MNHKYIARTPEAAFQALEDGWNVVSWLNARKPKHFLALKPVQQRLTKRQQETLDFIRQYRDEHGESPTNREIADALGASLCSAFRWVSDLEDLGRLYVRRGKKRGMILP